MPVFYPIHPKIIKTTFSFPEFAPARKKINSIHQLFLEIQSILESCDQTGHLWPSLIMTTPNVLCGFVSTCKKSGYFTVLGIWLIKKSCKLIEWEHFGPYLKNKILCMNTADDIHFHDRSYLVKINDQIFQ